MPQTLTAKWKAELGSQHNAIKKKWLHTLTNLTLTGYNPELSNKAFKDKKKIYQESKVYLNKYFQLKIFIQINFRFLIYFFLIFKCFIRKLWIITS